MTSTSFFLGQSNEVNLKTLWLKIHTFKKICFYSFCSKTHLKLCHKTECYILKWWEPTFLASMPNVQVQLQFHISGQSTALIFFPALLNLLFCFLPAICWKSKQTLPVLLLACMLQVGHPYFKLFQASKLSCLYYTHNLDA